MFKNTRTWGFWVAQLIKHPTSAQVMISWFESSSPESGSVLTAWSLEPASDSVSPSLSAPHPPSNININFLILSTFQFFSHKIQTVTKVFKHLESTKQDNG